jgi:Fe-Mn family superoxide dismutase
MSYDLSKLPHLDNYVDAYIDTKAIEIHDTTSNLAYFDNSKKIETGDLTFLIGESMSYEPLKLPYAYDALEPYIDAKTMEIHYTKHYQGYLDNLKKIEGVDLTLPIEELLIKDTRIAVQNQGGGFYNHTLFWQMMKPKGGGMPKGALLKAIENEFGTFEEFKEKFSKAALAQFGSGWAWLVKNKVDNKISILQMPNQNAPRIDINIPILGLDVWEHAYYLKYQNRRAEYIKEFWNVVNWEFCEAQYSRQ